MRQYFLISKVGVLSFFGFLIGLSLLNIPSASATTLSGGGNDEDSSWQVCGNGTSITFTNGGRFQAEVNLSGQMRVNGCAPSSGQIDQQGDYQVVGSGNSLDFYRRDGGNVMYQGSLTVTGGTVSGSTAWFDTNHYGGYWSVRGIGNQLQFDENNWTGVSFNDYIPPVANLTVGVNGGGKSHDVTANVGDTLNYEWRGSGGERTGWSSNYTVSPSTCPHGAGSGPWAWSATNDYGTGDSSIPPAQAGCTYTMTYYVSGPGGSDSDTITININAPATPPVANLIVGVNGGSKSHDVTANVGDTLNYEWRGSDGERTAWSSNYTVSPSTCPHGPGSGPWAWSATNDYGIDNPPAIPIEQAGCTYTMTYYVSGPGGSDSDTIYVRINAASAPETPAPGTPSGLTATPQACGTGQIIVTWNSVTGATRYDLEIDGSATNVGNATSYTHSGLVAGSSHTYRIRAANSTGTSAWSASVSTTAPSNCAAANDPFGDLNAVDCTQIYGWACDADNWSQSLTVDIYDGSTLISSPVANQTRNDVATACGSTTAHGFAITTPTSIKTGSHTISVIARNIGSGANKEIASSPKIVSLSCETAPGTPTGLTATPQACGTGQIVVTWTSVSGATGYYLEVDGAETNVGTATSYTHTGLTSGSTHSYRVRAVNSTGTSAWSSTVSATAPNTCPPTTSDGATCGTITGVPATMTPGQAFTASIPMTNSGTTTWVAGGTNPYKLGSQSLQDNTRWGTNRIWLSSDKAPGTSNTFTLNSTAPSMAGTYTFAWRMVHENVGWFGPTCSQTVTVSPTCTAVNGACGTANGTTVASAPTSNLCSSTSITPTVSGTGPWTWSCAGSCNGTTANCSANKTAVAAPTCSLTFNNSTNPPTADPMVSRTWSWSSTGGSTYSMSATVNNCETTANNGTVNPWEPWRGTVGTGNIISGSLVGIPGSGQYGCRGTSTYEVTNSEGTKATCQVNVSFKGSTVTPTAACGSANGVETSIAPTTSTLCNTGTAGTVTNTGTTFDWSCTSGTSVANCSAPQPRVSSCNGFQESNRLVTGVIGRTNGAVWGSGPYTTDSDLGTAAVHAGLLANGESGSIQIADAGCVLSYVGSTRNGVTTNSYSSPWYAMNLSRSNQNRAPTVDITSPTSGGAYPVSTAVMLTSTYSDLDGDSPMQYSFDWRTSSVTNTNYNLAAPKIFLVQNPGLYPFTPGTYRLWLQARDSKGAYSNIDYVDFTVTTAGTNQLTVCPDSLNVVKNGTGRLWAYYDTVAVDCATISPLDPRNRTNLATWSSPGAYTTVNDTTDKGLVRGDSSGTENVTASYSPGGGATPVSDFAAVTVREPSLIVCPNPAVVTVGGSISLAAWYDNTGMVQSCDTHSANNVASSSSWSSGNSSIANVDPNSGVVSGVSVGNNITVTAIHNGVSGSTLVNVAPNCTYDCDSGDKTRANTCIGDSYPVTDLCGNPQTCDGTRSCDFNWKEIAP